MSGHENQPDPMEQGQTHYESGKAYLEAHNGGAANAAITLTLGQLSKNQRTGEVKGLFVNVVKVLETDPDFDGRLRWNTLIGAPEWRPGAAWEEINDFHEGEIAATIERRYDFAAKPHVHSALNTVAHRDTHNPVADYLHALAWDGQPRVETWLRDYCGADEADPLLSAKGTCFLLSAVARALQPGCKVDTVLVLMGAQGIYKSTLLRILCGAPWFSDTPLPLGRDPDSFQALAGVWIKEMAEGASISKHRAAKIKAFLSSACDSFRASYGKRYQKVPRQTVFCLTTNEPEPLNDPTGARRFHVVPLSHVHREKLARDRDQIWAEAVSMYGDGSAGPNGGTTPTSRQWWLTAEQEEALARENVRWTAGDVWEDAIGRWTSHQQAPFSIAELLTKCDLQLDLKDIDAKRRQRAVAVMTQIGCTKGRRLRTDETKALGLSNAQTHWNPPGFVPKDRS